MSANWKPLNWTGWIIAMPLALFIAYGGLMLGLNADAAANHPTIGHHTIERPLAVYLHFLFGPIALAVGIFQLLPQLRAKAILHRWVGRLYVLSCLLSAIGGIWLGLTTKAGPIAISGFTLLGVFWFGLTLKAYMAARNKDFKAHRYFMLLSYSLTFAAVTLRIQIPLVFINQLDFGFYYPIIAWACWVPNLLIVWLWLGRNKRAISSV